MDRVGQILSDLVVYCSLFGLSLLLLKRSADRKLFKKLSIAASMILLCVFAGIRPDGVGTDVMVYGNYFFEHAKYYDTLGAYLDNFLASSEVAFLVVAYFSSKILDSRFWYYFLIQLGSTLPVFLVLYRQKKQAAVVGGMYYILTLYGASLNIMRQSMACGWLFLAFYYFRNKKYIPMTVALVVAALFHNSTIIGAALIFAGVVLASIRPRWLRVLLITAIPVVGAVVFANMEVLVVWLIEKGILSQKYSYYVQNLLQSTDSYMQVITWMSYLEVLLRILLLAVPWMVELCNGVRLSRRPRRENFNRRAVFYSELLGLIAYLFVFVFFKSTYGLRLAMYCDYILAFYYMDLVSNEDRLILRLPGGRVFNANAVPLWVISFVYFAIYFIVLGSHEISYLMQKFTA